MAAIELEGLTKDYGEVLANDGVTFDVERGDLRLPRPERRGEDDDDPDPAGVHFADRRFGAAAGSRHYRRGDLLEAKRRLGYLPDSPAFDETATGREILDLHASIKGDERSGELLELFQPPLDRLVREYSRGTSRNWGS